MRRRNDTEWDESLLVVVGRLKAANLLGANVRLLIRVEDGEDEADEVGIEHLIIELGPEIDVRWESRDVRMRVIPADDLTGEGKSKGIKEGEGKK